MNKSIPCCICSKNTAVYGYNYGACNDCVKALVHKASKKIA